MDMRTIEKFKALKPSEIIMAMVNGLRNPTLPVNMNYYVSLDFNKNCVGCAAANAICKIDGIGAEEASLGYKVNSLQQHFKNSNFISAFEVAVNNLRLGQIVLCNQDLSLIGLGPILHKPGIKLPKLTTENYLYNLEPYIELAKYNARYEYI